MEFVILVMILVLAASGGAWAMFEYMSLTQPEREEALQAEFDALQSAQRLSIAAWQARQHMADVVRMDPGDGA